jgi:hypothetical protein
VKNPNGGEEVKHYSPKEIMEKIVMLDVDSAKVLARFPVISLLILSGS